MPELPEVETVRLGLEKHVVGKTVLATSQLHPRALRAVRWHRVPVRRFGTRPMAQRWSAHTLAEMVLPRGNHARLAPA